jgi:putative peptidoglycan lipid II flippase
VISAVLAVPIVRLVYERGEFTAEQTPVVAGALAAFSLGLVFNGWMLMLNRAYYSLQSNWPPTLVALSNLAVNTLLILWLYRYGVWGIPLATSLANLLGAIALLLLLRPRAPLPQPSATAGALLRMTVAAAALAVASYLVWAALDNAFGRSLPAQLLSVGGGLAAGAAAYLAVCRLLGVRELRALGELRHSS